MTIGFRLAGALLALAGMPALAQGTTTLYLDLDTNPATGCSVVTDAGTIPGAEVRLRGVVGGDPLLVQDVGRAACAGSDFGAEQVQAAGHPVGIDVGTAGADVVEFSTPLAGLGDGGTVTAFFVADGTGGDSDLVQAPIVLQGVAEPPAATQPAIIPATGWIALLVLVGLALVVVRRHPAFGSTFAVILLMGSGIAWAANFVSDGQVFDWNGVPPVATDPADGGDASADLLAVFAASENGRLHVRFDVRDLEPTTPDNAAPTLADATFALAENSVAGTAVGSVAGTDPDAGQILTYAITAGNTGNSFAIDAATGAITVANAAALDAETTASFALTVTATDDGEPALSDTATVTITLTDSNEAPQIDAQAFSVAEQSPNGTAVGTVSATDPDASAPNATLSYAITAGNTGNAFAIDADTGAISVANSAQVNLANAPFALVVQVTDGGTPALQDSATVSIGIEDQNDAPQFAQPAYAFAVDENSTANTAVGAVSATDVDATDVLSYSIAAGNTANAFAVDAATGAIVVADASALDAETTATFVLTLVVSDNGTPSLTDSTTVTVTVDDLNEAPTLADSAASVAENSANGTAVGSVAGTDPDATAPNNTLTYAITAGNDDGAFAIDAATGAIVVAGALDFETVAAFALTVTVTDGGGLADTAQVAVAVTDDNEAPALDDTSRAVLQGSAAGTPVGAPVVGTDPDTTAPNNALAYAITAGNTGNAFAIDAGGQLRVATQAQITQGASFVLTVTVTDGGGLADSATVTITVADVNDAPSFVAGPSQSLLEDAAAVSQPWATAIDDNDPGTQALTFLVGTDNDALFAITPAISASGVLSFTAAPDANGTATVTVVLQDDGGTADGGIDTSAPQTFTISVTPVNDAPGFVAGGNQVVAEDAAAQTVAGWASAISPGPSNESGQTVNFNVSNTNPALFAAQPAVAPNGTLTFAPLANADGVATVSVTAVDDGGTADGGVDASAPQTFTITITTDDDAPVAVADSATVAEDSGANPIDVLANDTDVDGGPRSVASVTQPANGVVVITGGGTALTYQPNANTCNTPPGTAPDTFSYTLTPGGSSASVTVAVTCIDDAPVAVADSATVAEDAAATAIDVLANDTDVDGGARSVAAVTQPANGSVVITGGGTGLSYQPNANQCNTLPGTAPETFTYSLAPGGSTATVSVAVTCTDDAPLAVADSATVGEDSGANAIAVLANDTDVDGGPIAIASVTQPANGNVAITGGGTGLAYQPNATYCNTPPGTAPDTFSYSLAPGGSTATVSVAVTCVDNAPVAVADSATVAEDAAATAIDVLANDTDIDGGAMSIASTTQPANGSVAITGGGAGLSYQPNANYCNTPPGTALSSFSYTLAPGGSTATVTVAVTCSDDAPVAVADTASVTEDAAATPIDVLANDTDVDGGAKSVASVTQPANGVVAITGGGSGLSYQPNANYCNTPPGTALSSFSYTLAPGGSTTTVTVTVTCVDDAPVAVADGATVPEDSGANAIDVLANDTDVDGGAKSVAAVTQPANGVVVITGGGTGLSYQPNANYCGTADTFGYTLTPGTSSTTVSVMVICIDDAPVAVADTASVFENSGANAIDVLANDSDIDAGPRAVASVTQPANGVVVITGGGSGLSYQPNANYCNSVTGTPDVFTYALTPGGSSATVTMAVACVDDAPTAVADSATVIEGSGANAIDVLANDTDADGGAKFVAAVTQPANGIVLITGGGTGLSYQPNANYCNALTGTPDTFTYTLAPGGSSTTVSVTVTCVDTAPVAVADNVAIAGDTVITTFDVLANDTDVDGGPRTIASVTQPASNLVTIAPDGSGLVYRRTTGFCNINAGIPQQTFTYTLSPGGSTATVSVFVACPTTVLILSNGGGDTASMEYLGGSTDPVTEVDATGVFGDLDMVYSIAGGADAAYFAIDATTGVLAFVTPPNFDAPIDAGGDNVYEVIVKAAQNGDEDTQALSIRVIQQVGVRAKYVAILRANETTNLDVRVLDQYGAEIPGAPYTVTYTSTDIAVSATGQITSLVPGPSTTPVTISSPGALPWTTWVAVRNIVDVSSPHTSPQSISNGDEFSAYGSNNGLPTTSYYADFYRVTLPAGELEVTMDTGDDLDSYLLLANEQGYLVAGNDDDDTGALGVGSRMTYTITTPGTYIIEASTFNGLDTGNYTLGVSFTPSATDLGAFALNGSCGVLGIQGPGFTLTASATHPMPVGTSIVIVGSGVPNIGVFSVTGGTASVAVLSGTSRQITLTSALPAGATMAFRTTLSISQAFTLNGVLSLPTDYIGTGSKAAGSVSSTLILCSAT